MGTGRKSARRTLDWDHAEIDPEQTEAFSIEAVPANYPFPSTAFALRMQDHDRGCHNGTWKDPQELRLPPLRFHGPADAFDVTQDGWFDTRGDSSTLPPHAGYDYRGQRHFPCP